MSGDQTGRILAVLERLEAGQTQHRADLTAALDRIQANIDRIQANQDQLRADLTARLDRMQANIDRMQADQDQLRVELMERIDRLQNQVTLIGDDITVNMGRADLAHRMSDNTRGEVRALNEVVSGMMRQIQRLQTEMRDLRGEH